MTTEQFAYWLQGFAEINGAAPTEEQWLVIKDHLQSVFLKVTPDRSAEQNISVTGNPIGAQQIKPPEGSILLKRPPYTMIQC